MSKLCAAYKCRNRSKKRPGIAFYSFPSPVKEKDRFKLWVDAVDRKNWAPSRRSKLCSEHFEADCFMKRNGRSFLKPDAVPTMFSFKNHLQKAVGKKHDQRYPLHNNKQKFANCEIQTSSNEYIKEINQSIAYNHESLEDCDSDLLDSCSDESFSNDAAEIIDQNDYNEFPKDSLEDSSSDSLNICTNQTLSSDTIDLMMSQNSVHNDHSYHLPSLQKMGRMLHDTEEKVGKLQKALKISQQTLRRAKEKIMSQERIIRALEERLKQSDTDIMASCFCEVLYEEP